MDVRETKKANNLNRNDSVISQNISPVKKSHRLSFIQLLILILVLVFLLVVIFLLLKSNNMNPFAKDSVDVVSDIIIGEAGKVTTITETSLEEVFEISELSTADYTYNAIAYAYNSERTGVDYYVAYEGIVKAGIDFSKIIIEINEDEKTIYIKIPACEIQDTIVDFGSMEYIFANSSANNEKVSQAAYQICEADLKIRVSRDKRLLDLARENAVDAIEALIVPWVNQIDDSYKIEIQ